MSYNCAQNELSRSENKGDNQRVNLQLKKYDLMRFNFFACISSFVLYFLEHSAVYSTKTEAH